MFGRSGTVGNNFFVGRNFFVFRFKGFDRNIDRAFDMFGFVRTFGASVHENHVARIEIFFRFGERDARCIVRVFVRLRFGDGVWFAPFRL